MSEGPLPSPCQAVQLALVNGDRVGHTAHLESCAECGFFRDLSQEAREAAGGSVVQSSTALGAPFERLLAELLAGRARLGNYQLLELRGWGGQGHVFKARELDSRDTVAVKIVRVRPGEPGVDELVNARRVAHPNVCRVYHSERHGDIRLIAMELIEGPSLSEAARALTTRERLAVFERVARAVSAAHGAGVLHLDLKPSNVLMRGRTDPVVTDFGLSAPFQPSSPLAGPAARGWTRRYASPEQLAGDPVGVAADIYALGQVLADLTGDGPRWVAPVVRRATADLPQDRYETVEAFLDAVSLPGRRARRVRLALACAAVAGGLLTAFQLLPAPAGPRAAWSPGVWGPDTIPPDASNVALTLDPAEPPALSVSHPFFACGRHPRDLFDGRADYVDWEHGVAFPAPLGLGTESHFCVRLSMAGRCGPIEPDARLCRYHRFESASFEPLALTGRDLPSLPKPIDPDLGQLVPNHPCGERSFTVTLDRPRPVLAVRAWSHELRLPRYVRVDLLTDSEGTISLPAQRRGQETQLNPAREVPGYSVPITVEFSPVLARGVRFVIDTCSTLDDAQLARYRRRAEQPPDEPVTYPAHGWLYELEVFARPSKAEALWRWLRYHR